MQLKSAELNRVNNVLYVSSFSTSAHGLQHLLRVLQPMILVYDLYVTINIDTIQGIHVLQVQF